MRSALIASNASNEGGEWTPPHNDEYQEDKVNVQTNLRDWQPARDRERIAFSRAGEPAGPRPETGFVGDYADIELGGAAKRSDFDMGTVAIVGSIIVFKLLMLSVLLVAF